MVDALAALTTLIGCGSMVFGILLGIFSPHRINAGLLLIGFGFLLTVWPAMFGWHVTVRVERDEGRTAAPGAPYIERVVREGDPVLSAADRADRGRRLWGGRDIIDESCRSCQPCRSVFIPTPCAK